MRLLLLLRNQVVPWKYVRDMIGLGGVIVTSISLRQPALADQYVIRGWIS